MEIVILFVYLFICLLNLYFGVKANRQGQFITKMLLTPTLFFLYQTRNNDVDLFVLFALLFCFLGDLFLEYSRKRKYFLAGLASFLAGHVFLGLRFIQDTDWAPLSQGWFYLCVLAYGAYGIFFTHNLLCLTKKADKISVSAYCTVIIFMSLSALLRIFAVPRLDFLLVYLGSLVFILSDSILAINRFRRRSRYGGLWVMLTYGIALLLIILGL